MKLSKLVTKPVAAVADIVNTPTSARVVVDAMFGKSLHETVTGRVVLITGASSGIGEATAKRIAKAGGEVVLVARTRENLERVADEIRGAGGVAHVYPCDLSDSAAIATMADAVLADLGRVDILVNNAGRSIRRSLALSYDRIHDYERTMQLNYLGAVQLILKFVPGMRERGYGQIVNVSSIGVQTKVPRFGAYIASKAALDTLCDSLQAETIGDNVRFSTVHMPLVRTPMISPTKLYDHFPALTPEQAADVLSGAIVHRSRRVSPAAGRVAAFADAVNPTLMDHVRGRGFRMFPDSTAAKGAPEVPKEPTPAEEIFINATRGVHW
ncbi:SDR family NAD(P)-dependent oxidoreductase [Smaragdicoccus niigatensis]|uniref:SDR family NAD(P)-dependent oxidoreductase n=1 Tax=Smaragdicoccus niigatensis TaxID=359359 RepID=UPI00035ECFB1|nr:SDR family NAD(P)-dependent oxidoreductase [Smaragdicoccus niigatensis]